MSRRGEEGDELWAAIADPTRRRLLDALLAHGEATATVLAGDVPVTRQAVAKHLAILDRAGLVEGLVHAIAERDAERAELILQPSGHALVLEAA